MSTYHYSNFSNGYILEIVKANDSQCASWLLLPAENLWGEGLRVFLYIMAMLYVFLGVAIGSDIFMGSIEVITSKKRKIIKLDEEEKVIEREVLVWNETVANLTLMALGSSAPEILLAVVEGIQQLGKPPKDGLGPFTIIGSAAFNLLIITAICIISVPSPEVKKVREVGVFLLTSGWSIFAYIWMIICLKWISEDEIEPWEAFVTIAFMPLMVLTAYCQDNGWWIQKICKTHVGHEDQGSMDVRVVTGAKHGHLMHGPSKTLHLIEHEHDLRKSHLNLRSESKTEIKENGDAGSRSSSQATLMRPRTAKGGGAEHEKSNFTRARFRHLAVRAMMGSKKHKLPHGHGHEVTHMADIIDHMQSLHNLKTTLPEDLCGKFTFSAPSYSVLESQGYVDIDVLFHRRKPILLDSTSQSTNNQNKKGKAAVKQLANGGAVHTGDEVVPLKQEETSFNTEDEDYIKDIVFVYYETREASGKANKDFKFTAGKLEFKETEYCKTITIPIINDNQYEADVDFYVILKNAEGGTGLGDPSVARVTIIDDDKPGEFTFENPNYTADLSVGKVFATVLRQHGHDGTVHIEYSTINGTATGGENITDGVDYISSLGTLTFKHGETSKQIIIDVNKKAKGSQNFIITLRNPSVGCKIGEHSATVASITKDELNDRLAEILEEEEDEDWGQQFRNAFTISGEEDEEGNESDPTWIDYVLHFLTFLWKIILAFIPPKKYLGAWPTFWISMLMIGGMTAIVEQLGHLLGCVAGLKTSVTGITLVALGTSLPDTFASRTAALHDDNADAAIGNITGSNSVNVFLGLGLPWVIGTIFYLAIGEKQIVRSENLFQSVILFTSVGSACIIFLLFRRAFVGGELGGKNVYFKWGSSIGLLLLWMLYIVLASLKAYDIMNW